MARNWLTARLTTPAFQNFSFSPLTALNALRLIRSLATLVFHSPTQATLLRQSLAIRSKRPLTVAAQSLVKIQAAGSTSITYTFRSPVDIGSVANQIAGGSFSSGQGFTLTWIDQNGAETTSAEATTNMGYGYQAFPVGPPSLVAGFTITGNDGSVFTGFYFNGAGVAVSELGQADIKVAKIDESGKKIYVTGGTWTGADGSGTPNSPTKLEKVTPYDTKLTLNSRQRSL